MCVEATNVARQKFIRPVVSQPDIVATSWPTQKRGSSNFEALLPVSRLIPAELWSTNYL